MNLWDIALELIKILPIITVVIIVGTVILHLLMIIILKTFYFLLINTVIRVALYYNDRNGAPRGYKYIELPINTITMKLKESDASFSLGYSAPRDLRKWNDNSLNDSWQQNKLAFDNIQKEFASILADNCPCLFDASGYYYDEYPPVSIDTERVFELDSEDLSEWLADQEKITNSKGEIIGVRGINESTIDELRRRSRIVEESGDGSVFELIVPNVSEDILCKMKQEELYIYQDIKNCKFKIYNEFGGKFQFRFSDHHGYTKADMIQKAKKFAESKGYKFKIEQRQGEVKK